MREACVNAMCQVKTKVKREKERLKEREGGTGWEGRKRKGKKESHVAVKNERQELVKVYQKIKTGRNRERKEGINEDTQECNLVNIYRVTRGKNSNKDKSLENPR